MSNFNLATSKGCLGAISAHLKLQGDIIPISRFPNEMVVATHREADPSFAHTVYIPNVVSVVSVGKFGSTWEEQTEKFTDDLNRRIHTCRSDVEDSLNTIYRSRNSASSSVSLTIVLTWFVVLCGQGWGTPDRSIEEGREKAKEFQAALETLVRKHYTTDSVKIATYADFINPPTEPEQPAQP